MSDGQSFFKEKRDFIYAVWTIFFLLYMTYFSEFRAEILKFLLLLEQRDGISKQYDVRPT